jgi:hypothetical protein
VRAGRAGRPVPVVGVHDKNQPLGVGEVVAPERADLLTGRGKGCQRQRCRTVRRSAARPTSPRGGEGVRATQPNARCRALRQPCPALPHPTL